MRPIVQSLNMSRASCSTQPEDRSALESDNWDGERAGVGWDVYQEDHFGLDDVGQDVQWMPLESGLDAGGQMAVAAHLPVASRWARYITDEVTPKEDSVDDIGVDGVGAPCYTTSLSEVRLKKRCRLDGPTQRSADDARSSAAQVAAGSDGSHGGTVQRSAPMPPTYTQVGSTAGGPFAAPAGASTHKHPARMPITERQCASTPAVVSHGGSQSLGKNADDEQFFTAAADFVVEEEVWG